MKGYNVLRKGILSGARADFPYAEQFIIAEKDGKKCLFIRVFNPLEKSIDGVKISIRTFDKNDKIVSEEKLGFVFSCKGGERTVLPEAIQIDDKAVTCEAEIESVACEGQLLKLVGNKVKSFFDPSFSQKADVASVAKKNREQSSLIRKPAKLLAFVVACFVLIAMLVTTFALSGYSDTHDTFSIDNVESRFLNAADKDGDIVVTGYRGLAKNIVIPQEIDGHRIVGIDNNVFAHNTHMRTLVIEAEAAISGSAFANCYMLNSVKIRKPLAIGSYAFSMCQNLEKVEIEDASEITKISGSAFADCIKLKEFSVPQNVTEIGDRAFANCGALTTVSLPDSLKEIGSQAFSNCYSLQKVVIPKNVKAIGSSVFENCSMINEFEYTTDIGNFYQWFGAYNYDVPASLEKVTYNGEIVSPCMFYEIPNVKKVSLPNAVYIDNRAFFACWDLQSVQLAKGLLSIGSSAFEQCSNLEEITLPQSVAKIGERAFSDCNQLTSVNIPNSITRIEDGTFGCCYNLAKVTLPSNLKEIGHSAFYYCTNLKSIVIPDSVVSIEADAFSQCNILTELTIPKIFGTGISYLFGASDRGSMLEIPLEKVTIKSENIPDYAFFYATRLKEVIANNANAIGGKAFYQCYSLENLDSLAIESLGEEAFYGCGALSSVNLSDKLESVPNYTFSFCSSLTSVTLPSALKSIGDYAFQQCTNLSTIDGGNKIETIGSYAFLQCESLSYVTFPDGLQQIGDYAYQGCRSLTSVELPSTVNTVGRGAFSGCGSLTYMSLPEVYGANGSTDFYFSYIFSGYSASDNTHCIPDSLSRVKITATLIPDNAFMYCKQLKTIEIPNAEIIGSNAFYDCSSLENLVLSENLTTIQAYAFKDCYALSSIDLPSSVTSLGDYAFSGCQQLKKIDLPSSVTSLGDYAFSGCQQLKKIDLPSSVETVGQSAFYGCSNIEEMTLPKIYNNNAYGGAYFNYLFGGYNTDAWNFVPQSLKKVTVSASEIPSYAFFGCRYIEEINIENATSIGDCAFQGCSSLQNIALAPVLTSIGNGVFNSCTSLANINLPNGLTNIGESAFAYCSSLTQIDLPSTLTSIGESAFRRSYITSITIPSSVESVGFGAFAECGFLNEITLPMLYGADEYGNVHFSYIFGGSRHGNADYVPSALKKVTISASEIPSSAFAQCGSIEEINIENATRINESAFTNCESLQKLSLSNNLTYIENYAFNTCISLRTLTLPSSLSYIGDNAFLSCFKLYEIYNLSPLTLETGSTENGMVAYYAQVIHASQDEEPIQTMLTDELVELIFVNGEYIATMYTGGETSLTLGDLHYNGITVSNYSLAQGFINGTSVSALVIGEQVTALSNKCFESNVVLQTVDMSGASIQEIPDDCFAFCSGLYGVSVSNITNIGERAFYYCRSLGAISLRDDVNIGMLAFAECSNLQSIVIPVGAQIGESAFSACRNLLEVYNLAGLDLNDCSQTGYVGYNAVKVYDSLSEPSVVQRVTDSQGFKYAICDGQAYLYDFAYISDEPIQYFYLYDNFVYNNITYPYVVCSYAFESIDGGYNLIVPKTVKFKDENNKKFSNWPNVYYQGTADEWSENFGYSSYWWSNLYFKADCVHDYGCWAEKNGEIITSPDFSYRVIKEPTCSEEGIQERECLHCGEKTQIPISKSNMAHNVVDGICTDCGVSVVRITQENISDYFDVSYDDAYPFELQGDTFVSTNAGCPNSESRVTLTAKRSFNVSFLYYIWSEDSYDVLNVDSLGGSTIVGVSGYYIADGEPITVYLDVGYTLTFRYTKNFSNDVGEDVAKILEFTIYERS